jgi:hypothetical protein
VEIPKGKYSGQTRTTPVTIIIMASKPNTIAQVPERMPAKYKRAISAATMIRIMLSNDPMFFFMAVKLC